MQSELAKGIGKCANKPFSLSDLNTPTQAASVESERLSRLVRLFPKATDAFETEEEERRWLKRPQMRLGEQVPLEIVQRAPGARKAEHLLGRGEHGIPV